MAYRNMQIGTPVMSKQKALEALNNLRDVKKQKQKKRKWKLLPNPQKEKHLKELEELDKVIDAVKKEEESAPKGATVESVNKFLDISYKEIIRELKKFKSYVKINISSKLDFFNLQKVITKIIPRLTDLCDRIEVMSLTGTKPNKQGIVNQGDQIHKGGSKLHKALYRFEDIDKDINSGELETKKDLLKKLELATRSIESFEINPDQMSYLDIKKKELSKKEGLQRKAFHPFDGPAQTKTYKIVFTVNGFIPPTIVKTLASEMGFKHLNSNYYVADKAQILFINTESEQVLERIKKLDPAGKVKKLIRAINRKSDIKIVPVFSFITNQHPYFGVLIINQSSSAAVDKLIQVMGMGKPKNTSKYPKQTRSYEILVETEEGT